MTKRIAAPPIEPRARSAPAPLSFAQERLWFLEQLEPESSVYNICRASRLLGNVDISALQASLNEIISRHDTLRTTFRVVDGRPVQVVEPSQNISIDLADLRAMPTEEHNFEIQRRIKAEAERRFDLSAGQLLRCSLLRVSDQEHVLILLTHHSVVDAWSMGLMTRELWTLYEAFSNRKPSPFARLPVQYSDYAVWQRNWLQGDVLDTQLDYWKKQLENLSIVNLPTDRPRAPRQSFSGARVPITLPQTLTESVNDLSNRSTVTPFMTLLAAFQLLLYRYTGQEDSAVGSPIANRRRPEIEELIGFFVNTLVLRADLSGNPSFRELLSRVKDTCLAADANQDLPFEKLVQELRPERDLSRNPLFQVMFVLQNATSHFSGIPGLRVEPMELETIRSPFDLSLFLRERDGKYIGYIEYSADLFNRDRIERMAGHFQTLLEAIVADPDQSIATVPILTEAERHQILVEWNDTAAEYPKDKCIHELFEEQVERTPEAIALEFEAEEITYRELNQGANQLAHYLIGLGVGPETLVGICVERSIEMVVGLLGTLKAGGAYVPLDPAYPKERLRFMLDDTQVAVLLTQEKLVEDRGWRPVVSTVEGTEDGDPRSSMLDPRLQVVYLDRDLPMIVQHSSENRTMAVGSDNPAYVIYTSGSTGIPKGVIGTHRGAVNRFAWMWVRFPFESNEKCCVKTSLNFVDSVWEIFGPMLKGVRTTLIPDDIVKDIPRFVQILAQRRVTRIVLVPSLLQSILDTISEHHALLPDLKIWSSSGEPLFKELADQFRTTLPGKILLNLYGSSEVAADVTFYDCCDRQSGSKILIGRPINNIQTYILDSGLQPLPIGVTGELFIGGAGLACGYLNRPELTNETFIGNPFSGDPNCRIFKSGDLARYAPDGSIELLGRLDNQVKVRGYRIELGEIESALIQHPGIRHCAITVHRSESSSSAQIIGYIVPITKSDFSIAEVQRILAGSLPGYMVPSQFVILEGLPLMSNGKIDRNALASPDHVTPPPVHGLVEPRTEIEELIAQVWRETLKLDRIGIDDNFFQLGGHSLLATQIVTKLQFALAKQISVRVLFEAPTIARLARALESFVLRGDEPELPPIVAVSHKGNLPVSISQEPFFVVDQLIGGASFFNMPYAYRLSGPLNVSALVRAIQEIVRRHASLRTVFSEVSDRPTQTIRRTQKIRVPLINLLHLPSDQKQKRLKKLSILDATRRFKLTTGPVLRVTLVRLDDVEHVLLLTMPHIVTDQWSMGVFRSELGTLYGAYSLGLSSPLPEPSLQFVDFVVWEQRLLKQGRLQQQISYWKKQLAEPLSRLDFQRGLKGRRKRIRYRSARQSIEIEIGLLEAIKSFSRKENCTPFMVHATALMILLHLLTNEQDIRIATLAANRGQPGADQMIGYFVNLLILRNYVSPDMTGRQLLQEVRHTCLSAYARQDLPFDYLESLLEKAGVKKPLCQVMLNYRNFPIPAREVCGLTIASWDGQSRLGDPGLMISQLDMMIHLRDTTTKLTGAVNYKTDLFTDERVRKMMNSFRGILTHLTTYPDSRLADCFILLDE